MVLSKVFKPEWKGSSMNKNELLQSIISTLKKNIENAGGRAQTVLQALIDAPGAMQSHSDTTKSQMGRIADALQKSLSEQNSALNILQSMANFSLPFGVGRVEIGSLVEVADDSGEKESYLILPAGGGIEIDVQDKTILVVTSQAPIATALINKKQGESVELKIGRLTRKLTILDVQ